MYIVRRWWGREESDVPIAQFEAILRELDAVDDEHPNACLKHESEWVLSYFKSGLMVFENAEEEGEPRHMNGVTIERAAMLWSLLARGDLATLESEVWRPGYSSKDAKVAR